MISQFIFDNAYILWWLKIHAIADNIIVVKITCENVYPSSWLCQLLVVLTWCSQLQFWWCETTLLGSHFMIDTLYAKIEELVTQTNWTVIHRNPIVLYRNRRLSHNTWHIVIKYVTDGTSWTHGQIQKVWWRIKIRGQHNLEETIQLGLVCDKLILEMEDTTNIMVKQHHDLINDCCLKDAWHSLSAWPWIVITHVFMTY